MCFSRLFICALLFVRKLVLLFAVLGHYFLPFCLRGLIFLSAIIICSDKVYGVTCLFVDSDSHSGMVTLEGDIRLFLIQCMSCFSYLCSLYQGRFLKLLRFIF